METDYVDLTKISAPEAPKFKPNKAAVIKNGCLKKNHDNNGIPSNSVKKVVTFGDDTTHYFEKYEEEYSE